MISYFREYTIKSKHRKLLKTPQKQKCKSTHSWFQVIQQHLWASK